MVTISADGTEIAVSVRSRVGKAGPGEYHVTAGVLVDSAVVAFPIDPEVDFQPVEVEAVIATLPLDTGGAVERIPAAQVDILVPQGTVAGRQVAFATLMHPSTQLGNLPETSPGRLLTAVRDSGDLWAAVTTECGQRPAAELPARLVREDDGPHGPRPTVRTRVAKSVVLSRSRMSAA